MNARWAVPGVLRHDRSAVPEHRSFLVVDTVGSGRWDDPTRLRACALVREVVRAAFRAAGVAWWRLAVEDRGDGLIVLAPPSVSKVDLIDPVLPRLAEGLRRHNASTDPAARVRLRVAVHAGEVIRTAFGWVGADLNRVCRLVDGAPLRRELDRRPDADLALVVSDVIHDGVVRHGYRRIDPTRYTPVRVVLKELDARAWLHVPEPRPLDGRPAD
ncbi:hypothetical protein [Saccharothrix sp. HUAS TT1]|uniref:hypothetical protein n=1 Tax=unclassified Saccharothrix TaxID=2593673 RepID=UPI00345BED21